MNAPQQKRSGSRGSTAVLALVIVMIGSTGMAAMMAYVHANTILVDSTEEAFMRRIRHGNSQMMAVEFLHKIVLPSNSGDGGIFELPDNWGRIEVDSWADSAFSTTAKGSINPLSPGGNGEAFALPINIEVFGSVNNDGEWESTSGTKDFEFRVCGRNPCLAGTLVGVHRSASGLLANNAVTGSITANGGSFIWESDALFGDHTYDFAAERFNLMNKTLSPLEYLLSPVLGGDEDGDELPYMRWFSNAVSGSVSNDGLLNVVNGPNANSMTGYVQSNGGVSVNALSGYNAYGISNFLFTTTVDLDNPSLKHVIIGGLTTTVNLEGQTDSAQEITASTMDPVVIILNSGTIATVNITSNNQRPILLGVKKTFGLIPVTLSFSGTDTFRMIYVSEETPTTINTGGATVTLEGGILSDRNLTQTNGTLNIVQEDAPDVLDQIAPRFLWVEGYQQ